MFNDDEDVAAYEDELYREASSSDESIDSEVEFHLYSQVHYSQSLSGTNKKGLDEPGAQHAAAEQRQIVDTGFTKEMSNVITISDSDDLRASDTSAVLILSDSIDEDSVNFLKAKGKLFCQMKPPTSHSTPMSLTARKNVSKDQKAKSRGTSKSYKGGVIQEVLVIRGSSEDEATVEEYIAASDSDQSDVENWMLLGRGNEDGDANIQLNLHGSRIVLSEGESEMDWSIGKKDSEARIANYSGRRSNRYYTEDKNVICRNCNYRGHLSKNCPVPRKLPACSICGRRGHMRYSCPFQYCSNCFLPGHFYQDCTERPFWQKKCHRCAVIGHYADACPEIWRQYHLTVTPGQIKKSKSALNPKSIVYCCNCGRRGHCSYECKERRMHSSVHASCELIGSYDNEYEIQKRNKRAKRKCAELQEAGLLQPLQIFKPKHNVKERTSFSNQNKKKRKKESQHAKQDVNLHLKATRKLKSKKRKQKLIKHEEEDFPRGRPDENAKKNGPHKKKKPKHLLFKHLKDEKDLHGHSKKRRRKSKGKKGNHVAADLLTIKQRKKKIKKEN